MLDIKPCSSFLIIDYQEGYTYEADFIVETEQAPYLFEIKCTSYKLDVSLYSLRYNLLCSVKSNFIKIMIRGR